MNQENSQLHAQKDGTHLLWSGGALPPSADMPQVNGASFQLVNGYDPDKSGYHWLKGLAMARHEGCWIGSFGHNATLSENNATELANLRLSRDAGRTWGPLHTIDNPCGDLAVSHGIFLTHHDQLWTFLGAFYGQGRPGGRVHTRAYLAEPGSIGNDQPVWQKKGVVAWDGFWPLQEPVQMDNGQYIVAGASIGSGEINNKNTIPAVALVDGDDPTQWSVVRIPVIDDRFGSIWGESTVVVQGANVLLISRSNHPLQSALVSTSSDYGRSWTPLADSNLPMVNSKPYAGRLSDGRPYLINTLGSEIGSPEWFQDIKNKKINERNPLCILVGDRGSMTFNKAWRLIDSRQPLAGAETYRLWAYPYAVEWDGNLVVGFYMNGSDQYGSGAAGYVTVPLDSLT